MGVLRGATHARTHTRTHARTHKYSLTHKHTLDMKGISALAQTSQEKSGACDAPAASTNVTRMSLLPACNEFAHATTSVVNDTYIHTGTGTDRDTGRDRDGDRDRDRDRDRDGGGSGQSGHLVALDRLQRVIPVAGNALVNRQ